MEVLTYDEVDPFEVYKLGMITFGWPITPKYVKHRLREDPRVLDGFAIYAVEKGKVLSQVVPLKMDVRLTSGVETVGGLQGVCSHPTVWGQGYAWRLMERAHEMFRDYGFRISTLLTSRNIRGYGIYKRLGYVTLPPSYRASRRLARRKAEQRGVRIQGATKKDLKSIQAFYEEYNLDMYGWSRRDPRLLSMKVSWDPTSLTPYRMVLRNDESVGYLRVPGQGSATDEVIVPDEQDFADVVRAREGELKSSFASVDDLTARRDLERLRALGYEIYGPKLRTYMALSLDPRLETKRVPQLFGAETEEFILYPTDGF